jgi:hypothetical protein
MQSEIMYEGSLPASESRHNLFKNGSISDLPNISTGNKYNLNEEWFSKSSFACFAIISMVSPGSH